MFFSGTQGCHPHKRFITVGCDMGFGNNMGQYATLLYYSKVLDNVTAFIKPCLKNNLQKAFPLISLPAYEIPNSCKKMIVQMDKNRDGCMVVLCPSLDIIRLYSLVLQAFKMSVLYLYLA